jgi:hypothetical protein
MYFIKMNYLAYSRVIDWKKMHIEKIIKHRTHGVIYINDHIYSFYRPIVIPVRLALSLNLLDKIYMEEKWQKENHDKLQQEAIKCVVDDISLHRLYEIATELNCMEETIHSIESKHYLLLHEKIINGRMRTVEISCIENSDDLKHFLAIKTNFIGSIIDTRNYI